MRVRLRAKPSPSYLHDFIYGAVTTFAVVAGGAGANLDETVETILAGANLIADGFSMAASNFLGSRPQPSSRAGGAAFAARWPSNRPADAPAAAGSGWVESAGGEDVTGRYRLPGAAGGVQIRSVKAASCRCRDGVFGLSAVCDEPLEYLPGASPGGDDRSPFDDRAARGMGSCQPIEQQPYRVVVHLA